MNLGIRRLIDRNFHSEDSDKKKMARMLDALVDGMEDVQLTFHQGVLWQKCEDLKTEIGKIINES